MSSFMRRVKYVSLPPAKLNGHKIALSEWNGVRLLGEPRGYKH